MRWDRRRVELVPVRRVAREPVRADPIAALASREEDVRVDTGDEAGLRAAALALEPPAEVDVAGSGAAPAGDPQTLQYPSSIAPGHPGWVQPAAAGGVVIAVLRSGAGAGS